MIEVPIQLGENQFQQLLLACECVAVLTELTQLV